MIYEMKLRKEYFDKILLGEKIYEVRLNDEKRQKIDVGDIIVFKQDSNLQQTVNTIVEDLIYFDSFSDMAKTLPSKKIGFNDESIIQIIDKYHEFYNTNDEEKYGIVAIKIKVLKERYSICNN